MGTCASVGVHFMCCGLPLVLALFGSGAAFLKIPRDLMTVALAAAGAMLAVSIFMEIRGCGCKKSRAKTLVLVLCGVLYFAGLAGHFNIFGSGASADGPAGTYEAACH